MPVSQNVAKNKIESKPSINQLRNVMKVITPQIDKKKLEEAKAAIKISKKEKEAMEVMDLPDSPGAPPPLKVENNLFKYDSKTQNMIDDIKKKQDLEAKRQKE